MNDQPAPEHVSIEAFGEYLLDEGRSEFSFAEAEDLARGIGHSTPVYAIRGLLAYGFKMEERAIPKPVRGFRSNSHDRWYGPGSCPTHGGSGWEQISGFSGQEG